MIALAKVKGEPLLPPQSGYRKPIVQRVSSSPAASAEGTMPLAPSQVAAIKAAIEAQQDALATKGNMPEVDTSFTQPREELEQQHHKPKPKARGSSGKKKFELRSTGTEQAKDDKEERREKRRAKAEMKEARRLARKLAENERKESQPVVDTVSNTDETITVCWKQRISRKEVMDVQQLRTVNLERWFDDNKPECFGFTLIQSPRFEYRQVARRQVVRIGNLDVSLGYENVLEMVPVGVSRVQADNAVAETARSVFSKSPAISAEKRQRITEGMQQRLVKIRTPLGASVPWVLTADDMRPAVTAAIAANDVTQDVESLDYDDPGRMARIRHMAYVKYHMPAVRLASPQTQVKAPLVPTAVRKAFRQTLASRLANTYHYDMFESGDYTNRIKTNLLRNATESALRGLAEDGWSRLFYSAERSENANYHSTSDISLEEQVARLEAMSPLDDTPLDTPMEEVVPKNVMQAAFDAAHYRPDLRTKKQRGRDALAEQKAIEDAFTKEWVSVNIAQRKELYKQEDLDKVRQAIGWLDEQQAVSQQADVWNQDQARLDAWLESREAHNNRDAELLDDWLMRRSGVGHLAGVLGAMARRFIVTADDRRYLMWLHDNASDDYRYERWLQMNQTPRAEDEEPVFTGDNVVDMMKWRHRLRGTDNKASVKTDRKVLKLILPKTPEVAVYDHIMRDTDLQNDPKRDQQVTSFGKVVRDIKEVLGKFNKDEGSGLYLPDYLKPEVT